VYAVPHWAEHASGSAKLYSRPPNSSASDASRTRIRNWVPPEVVPPIT